MIRQLAIITLIDIVLIGLWVYSMHPDTGGDAMGIFILVPVIIIANLVIWFLLKARENKWAKSVLINALIAPIIMYIFFDFAIKRNAAGRYKIFYFSTNHKKYSIDINLLDGDYKDDMSFEFFEVSDHSSSTIGVNGRYYIKGDTVILATHSGKPMMIIKTQLINYPKEGSVIELTND